MDGYLPFGASPASSPTMTGASSAPSMLMVTARTDPSLAVSGNVSSAVSAASTGCTAGAALFNEYRHQPGDTEKVP